jgi:acetyltransferase-like isoleucine patch superfamily enzyme
MNATSSKLKRSLLYRLYLLTIRGESQLWLGVRRWIFDQMLGRKHDRLNIFPDVFVEGIDGLKLGDNVSINRACNLSAFGGLTIGNDVSIAHATSILTTEHGFSDPSRPIKEQPVAHAPVTIGDNVWIGAQVCILAGVSLAPGTIVGAGSVVKHPVTEKNCTIAGVPAKILKRRG